MIQEKIKEEALKNPNKLYGILLFTEEDPIIVKVLNDVEFYDSIDSRSGEELDIFASMLFKGKQRYPQVKPNQMALMLPIWVEPKQNKDVFSLFDIKDSRELPLFVLFGVESANEEEGFSFYHKSKVNTESIEKAYKSIENIITIASETVKSLEEIDGDTNEHLRKILSKKIIISKTKTGAKEVLKRLPIGPLFGKLF